MGVFLIMIFTTSIFHTNKQTNKQTKNQQFEDLLDAIRLHFHTLQLKQVSCRDLILSTISRNIDTCRRR
jgi:hypothetical protein